MTDEMKYELWLKFRVGKKLGTDESVLTTKIGRKPLSIQSEDESQPLSKAHWLVMNSKGFDTVEAATAFGEDLRRGAHMAGLCARVGVDAGDPEEDRTLSYFNPELLGGLKEFNPEVRLGPDVHGLVVLPDDGNTVFMRGRARGEALANAGNFADALEEALSQEHQPSNEWPSVRRAIRILNLAEMNQDPIAKLVLAVSTIEGLARERPWSSQQLQLIENAASGLEQSASDDEALQVAAAIRNVHQESIRQRIRHLLAKHGLSNLWREWDNLYNKRSRLFHGRPGNGAENRGQHLDELELHKLGHAATTLCASIVLSIGEQVGMPIPHSADLHFDVRRAEAEG